MSVFAVIDGEGLIVNRIVLHDEADYTPEAGLSLVRDEDELMMIGGTYKDGIHTPPALPEGSIIVIPEEGSK